MSWVNKTTAFVLENVNGCVFVCGAITCYAGIRGFSPNAADVVAGVLLMAIGAFPYVLRLRKRKPCRKGRAPTGRLTDL